MSRRNRPEKTNDKIVRLYNEGNPLNIIAQEAEVSMDVADNVLRRKIKNYTSYTDKRQQPASVCQNNEPEPVYNDSNPAMNDGSNRIPMELHEVTTKEKENENNFLQNNSAENPFENFQNAPSFNQQFSRKATVIPEVNVDKNFQAALRHEPTNRIDVGDSGKSKLDIYMSSVEENRASEMFNPPFVQSKRSVTILEKNDIVSNNSVNDSEAVKENEVIKEAVIPVEQSDTAIAGNAISNPNCASALNKMQAFLSAQIEENKRKIEEIKQAKHDALLPELNNRQRIEVTLNQKSDQKQALEERFNDIDEKIKQLEETLKEEVNKRNRVWTDINSVSDEMEALNNSYSACQGNICRLSEKYDAEINNLNEEIDSFKHMTENYT